MKYYFSVNMSSQEFLPYYKGQIQAIVVTTNAGIKVQLPAIHFRKFLSTQGIKGHFCLETKDNKFLSLTKIS